jgi:hypothetical protein
MTPAPESSSISEGSAPASEVLGNGRYAVVGSLGAGSQGETLAAVDKREGRPVAIKRFTIRGAKSWKDVELAERVAAVLASLNHPSLPRYIEHFEENGALCLVMEKVEGESLSARRKRGQALDHTQVLRFLKDAAACLRYLHGHAPPIVHRDIKPGNVILRPDGSYCFVDFGSVRDRLKPEGGSTVVGTFGYMAPEQFQGRAAPGSDVYAVGATALSLLTGREPEDLPHKGLAIDVEAALRGQVDRRLIAALRAMLEPDPDRRAASVDTALRTSGLSEPAAGENSRSAEALKRARQARLEAESARRRHWEDADAHHRAKLEHYRERLEEHRDRQERHRAERDARRARKAAEREARRAERYARRYAAGQWRGPGRPVPPGMVLGMVLLLALRVASVATFALFSVLLPLLFTIVAVPGRRQRMLEIGRAGQRGLARAREHVRYQFLGGPTPSGVASFMRAAQEQRAAHEDARPRARVSIDAEAEELELEAERLAAEAEGTSGERSRRSS